MPKTDVFFYAEPDGRSPAIDWLDGIPNNPRDKLFLRVSRLEELRHELRRPESDFLRNGIHELRVRSQRVNYRLLYFFHNKEAVIAHGCTKESAVGSADIERAIGRKNRYQKSPQIHRYFPAGK
jgi:phage-related protein